MARRPNKAVGIDIGTTSIRIVEGNRRGTDFSIDRAYEYMFNEEVMRDGLPEEVDVLGIHLQRAMKQLGGSKEVTMSVPSTAIMTYNAVIDDNLKGDELFTTLEANLGQYIPFSADEVMMDCQVIGSSIEEEYKNEVLIVAAEKEFVNSRSLSSEIAGLEVKIVDADIYALTTLLGIKYDFSNFIKQDAIVYIESGVFRTGFFVLKGDGTIYAREMPIGGDRLTEMISDELDISMDDAEIQKLNADWEGNPILAKCKEAFIEEMVVQVQSAMHAYVPNNPQVSLKQIFVTGGGALVPGYVEALSGSLDRTVERINPSDMVQFNVPGVQAEKFAIACGLAVRSML